MLKIKDGKLYGSNYSFTLPERLNLEVDSHVVYDNSLMFWSDDQLLSIEIFFDKQCHSAKNDIKELVGDSCLIKSGNFISVKRGKGVGVGLHYGDGYNHYYEERYDFEKNEAGETQLIIDISLLERSNELRTIKKVTKLPVVKAFLESLEYF